MYHIPGFNLERNDRRWDNTHGQTKKGGGLACYIKQNLTYSRENDDMNISSIDIETLWITILIPNMRKIVICTLYRPPQGNIKNFTNLVEKQIQDIYDKYGQPFDLFVLGDCNIDYMNIRAMGRSDIRDL